MSTAQGVRREVLDILMRSRGVDGKLQALDTKEIRSRYFVRNNGTYPKGLSKRLADLKNDGEITCLNKGVYIATDKAAVKPAVAQLFSPEKLPARRRQHPAEQFPLSAAQVVRAAHKVNFKITTRQLVALTDLGWIPGTRVRSGRYYYATDVLVVILALQHCAKGAMTQRRVA